MIAGSLAALIAGIGGSLYAMAQTTFQPSEFATFAGVVWLAVLVTIGVRSTTAALIAGLALVFPNALFSYYLPSVSWLTYALSIAFGVGAIFRGQVSRSGDQPLGRFGIPVGVSAEDPERRITEQVS